MTANEHCDPNSDGYRDFIKRQLAANDVVYLVWTDHNRPHGIDYDILRERQPAGIQQRMSVVHCTSIERAMTIKRIYRQQ